MHEIDICMFMHKIDMASYLKPLRGGYEWPSLYVIFSMCVALRSHVRPLTNTTPLS